MVDHKNASGQSQSHSRCYEADIQNIIDTLPFRDMPFCIFASSSTRIKNDKIKDMGCDKATVISA